MLILSRAENQRIRIEVNGVEVWVAVLRTGDGRVKLGIDAPQSVSIAREELLAAEQKRAA